MKRFILSALALALVSSAAIATSPTGQKQAEGLPPEYSSAFTRATQAAGVDAVDGQLAGQLPHLKELAQQGDVTAAAQLFTSLAECDAWATYSPTSAYSAAHCAGITRDDMSQVGKWLGVAAELGNTYAQYAYAHGGFDYVLGLEKAKKDPAALDAYARKSKAYLDGLARQCNFDGIGGLARDLGRDGLVFKKDVDEAYKFLVVEQTIARVPSSANAVYQAELEGQISPASKIVSLRQDALAFVDQYCR
jgi:hypothetical protein